MRVTRQYITEHNYYQVIKHAQEFLEKNFKNKIVSYTFQRYNQIEVVEVEFRKNGLSHLVGLEYSGIYSKNFWIDLKKNTIDWRKIHFTNDDNGGVDSETYFEMKMEALKFIDLLITEDARISDGCLFSNSYVDKVLRTKDDILGIGLKLVTSKTHVMTTTRLLSDAQENIKSGSAVISISAYDKSTKETVIYYSRESIDEAS
ncbi:PBECR4 domain-containing protein [Leuconostoc pseudomesenteroides]|uniref:PBECR4 domain-containing protein n=1 Tax=Leuconostoc pseudomesenteroides TaxID=33968 RepID=UPI0039ECA1BF